MNKLRLFSLALVLVLSACATSQDKYPVKGEHPGRNVMPGEAYKMMKKDLEHTFLVDVRTRYEYQDVGHAEGAYNVPFEFYTAKLGEKGYMKVVNKNFCSDLRARFNSRTDTLLLICRSSKRSVAASKAAVECGFNKSRVYSVLSGFEGDKIKDENSSNYGKRLLSGWRNEGLPWTYKIDKKLAYQADRK